jgi:hypothetical protein
MPKKTVAQTIVATLAAAGVKRVYGVAGDSLNGCRTHGGVAAADDHDVQ